MKDNHLTNKEVEVLKLLYKGYTNPQISKELYVTISTTKAHVSEILRKINAKNRIELLLMLLGEEEIQNVNIKKQLSEVDWKG